MKKLLTILLFLFYCTTSYSQYYKISTLTNSLTQVIDSLGNVEVGYLKVESSSSSEGKFSLYINGKSFRNLNYSKIRSFSNLTLGSNYNETLLKLQYVVSLQDITYCNNFSYFTYKTITSSIVLPPNLYREVNIIPKSTSDSFSYSIDNLSSITGITDSLEFKSQYFISNTITITPSNNSTIILTIKL